MPKSLKGHGDLIEYPFRRSLSAMVGECCYCSRELSDDLKSHVEDNPQSDNCTACDQHGVKSECLLSHDVFSMERIWTDPLHMLLRLTDLLQKLLTSKVGDSNEALEALSAVIHKECNKLSWPFSDPNLSSEF